MKFLKTLERDVTYEVLVSTINKDATTHVKPFGVKFNGNHFILNLFPNKTLFNIKNNNDLKILFTNDIEVYTRALLSKLNEDYEDRINYIVNCKVENIDSHTIEDSYGKNIITRIIVNPVKITKVNEITPLINRATSQIIELLVDYSRYDFMDVDSKDEFSKKLEFTERLIEKTGNYKHKNSIKLLKKELKKE